MYEPRNPRLRRPLKHRYTFAQKTPLTHAGLWAKVGWLTLLTLSPTTVPPRVIPRIYTYIKKLVRYPQNRTRFWVNAQCAYLVTRKPLNVRMGKGKGAKVRLYSYVKRNVALASVSRIRLGLQRRLRRFVSIRLGRPVVIAQPSLNVVEWTQRHRIQTTFLRTRAAEVQTLLTYVRRPALKLFFNKLFRVAWRRPRLRWRSKWPLLPKISMRLKTRRRSWGAGVKRSTPVWAGLASLLAGVRRVKAAKAKIRSKPRSRATRELMLTYKRARHLLRCHTSTPAQLRNVLMLTKGLYRTLPKLVYARQLTIKRQARPSITMPYSTTLSAFRLLWGRIGFNPSSKELALLSHTSGIHPSLPSLVKMTSFLEKSAWLLISPFTSQSTASSKLIQSSLSGRGKQTSPSACENLLLSTTLEANAFDLWPSTPLRPLLLTHSLLTITQNF